MKTKLILVLTTLASTLWASPLLIEEYLDLECHFCKLGAATMHQLEKDFPGKIQLVTRQFPLPAHAHAVEAAKALAAMRLQGADLAERYEEAIFADQDQLAADGRKFLWQLAEKIGADVERLKADSESGAVTEALASDLAAGKAHQVRATPTFLVGSEKVEGALPYAELKKIIERHLD